uniref:Ovule protein n=1 Tax=Heterorhabditis bacteriophora TaxID=37862 RepID=A0A1I7WZJ3_HETBA
MIFSVIIDNAPHVPNRSETNGSGIVNCGFSDPSPRYNQLFKQDETPPIYRVVNIPSPEIVPPTLTSNTTDMQE